MKVEIRHNIHKRSYKLMHVLKQTFVTVYYYFLIFFYFHWLFARNSMTQFVPLRFP